jgi:mRNA-degrading endonuclease toxin of MazEF toxin-antitoxin module
MKVDRGCIVQARVLDAQHRNPKVRPVVIVTSATDLDPGDPHLAVAITGTLPLPLPSDYVELPWHSQKHPRTGLTKPSAAACGWLVEVMEEDMVRICGRVPDDKMLEILEKTEQSNN